MNIDPPREFDPGEALSLFAEPDSERYGLADRVFFFLLMSCRAVESFAEPVFSIEQVLNPKDNAVIGCAVKFIIRRNAFLIDTGTRVRLWASEADEPDNDDRHLVHDGDASDPLAWDALLQSVGRVEGFGVFVPHADRLRQMWSEWVLAQKRLRDERGF